MFYNITSDGVTQAIAVTITAGGEAKTYQLLSTDDRFKSVLERVLAGDESVVDLFNVGTAITRKLEDQALSERISVRNGVLYFDGDVVHDVIADQIIGFLEEDVDDWLPLVLFLEKLYANQSEDVRNGLYNWISQQRLTITEDGNFLGYKGLRKDYTSIHAGPGIVNNQERNGNLDNSPGNIVEVARSYVNPDGNVHCSTGLHVGTRAYATGFAEGQVVVCEVDPRNVVSVPYDGHEKIRTSRYEVIEDVADSYGAVYTTAKKTNGHDDHAHFTFNGAVSSANIVANTITTGWITANQAKAAVDGPKRDAQGRFVKGGQTTPRDAQGRFLKS